MLVWQICRSIHVQTMIIVNIFWNVCKKKLVFHRVVLVRVLRLKRRLHNHGRFESTASWHGCPSSRNIYCQTQPETRKNRKNSVNNTEKYCINCSFGRNYTWFLFKNCQLYQNFYWIWKLCTNIVTFVTLKSIKFDLLPPCKRQRWTTLFLVCLNSQIK